ncbi:unnamed protein product [Tuber melanosporum]|uniref:glutaminase n=1 Tax=Tuber melanosporum (strain Mel28) TaxID=656061 RepID=D5GBA8_TUBMM|nr:uncharacterized protein GSTUM_00000394001 [Tuber melanosporum]CAZ81801.1 unnamed protein product [Tuber melanosporum]
MSGNDSITVGVLALQGAFSEHLELLKKAAEQIETPKKIGFISVKTPVDLEKCSALIIPGGESTTMALIAERSNILEPLREFVKVHRRPTWGTCAGMILLSEAANRTKKGGQALIGGLSVRVNRNHFGRQVESFDAPLDLSFLGNDEAPFRGVFIRAPIVESILPKEECCTNASSIVAVRQGNVVGTSFHPELTGDLRMHKWWLGEILKDLTRREELLHAQENH